MASLQLLRTNRGFDFSQHRPFLIFLAISNMMFILFLNYNGAYTAHPTPSNDANIRTNVAALRERNAGIIQGLHEQPNRILAKQRERENRDRWKRINRNLAQSMGRNEARKILGGPFQKNHQNIYDFDPSDPRPVMNTFYQQSSNSHDLDALAVWKFAWSKAGWNPRVLNLGHAQTHPDYEWAVQNIDNVIPLDDPKDEYNKSWLLRHFAMSAMGGGWMSDYNTLPTDMEGAMYGGSNFPNNGVFTSYTHESFAPAIAVGTANEWDRISKALIEEGVKAKDTLVDKGSFFTDKMAFEKLKEQNLMSSIDGFVYGNPELPIVEETCSTLGKALHFSHQTAGVLSRAMVMIETLEQMTKKCHTFNYEMDGIVEGGTYFYLQPHAEEQVVIAWSKIMGNI